MAVKAMYQRRVSVRRTRLFWRTPWEDVFRECKVIGLLDGMRAIAVTDGREIVVARDPIGKKPLYYLRNGGVIYFSSEKKRS